MDASSWGVPSRGADAAGSDPTVLSARSIAGLVGRGELSAEQVALDHLHRIAELDSELGALVLVDAERALAEARRVDRRRARGRPVGRLAGVPYVVKDNVDVRRHTTSSGSHAHAGVVALRDATVVSRLREAGAVLLGRANMDELAMGASTASSAFGVTRNPWDRRRSPGGSSGGSAAAVAAGLATLSIGSDTGGSIREPAAQCGLVGMAPSPGLVPMSGVVPFAPELDRLGPLARTATDAALLLAVLSGRPDLSPRLVRPLRVGVVEELSGSANRADVAARFEVARAAFVMLGARVSQVSIPDAAAALETYLRISSAACVRMLEPYLRTGQAGAEVRRRHAIGVQLVRERSGDLATALTVQRRLTAQTADALSTCDVLISPTMPTTAPFLSLGERSLDDPMAAPYTDCWTVVANLAGVPSVSVPAGVSPEDGMPVGVMLTGARGSDRRLLALAAALETTGLADR